MTGYKSLAGSLEHPTTPAAAGSFLKHNFPSTPELFPSSRFRMAFDELKDKLGPRGSKEYLAILELAAKEGEAKVDEALRVLLEKGAGWVRVEAVREALRGERTGSIREVQVASVDLRLFDELCGSGEVLQ